MQDTMCRSVDATECEFEEFERRFVGLSLLRGDDFIEVCAKLRPCRREEIVVHIRENRYSKASLELPKCGDCVRPRFPGRQRVRQGTHFLGAGSEAELCRKLADDRLQNL